MKTSTYLTLMMACVALSASADISPDGQLAGGNPRILNHEFCSGNTSCIYIVDFDDDESANFTVFDSDFKELKNFTAPAGNELTTTVYYSNELYGPVSITETSSNDELMEWMQGCTQSEFAERCRQDNFTRVENHGSEVWYLSDNLEEYEYSDIYGTKYPRVIRLWRDGQPYQRFYNYSYGDWGNTGIYSKPEEQTRSSRPSITSMELVTEDCDDNGSIYLSQTLFNNDALFEWIMPVYEAVDVNYTNGSSKIEGQEPRCTGLKVMSENGSMVTTVKFPEGYSGYDECSLYKIGGKYYLVVEVQKTSELYTNAYYSLIYSVTPGSSSLKQVNGPTRMRVNPTKLNQGTPITVDLGGQAGNQWKLTVVSVGGNTVLNRNIEPGVTSAVIDTAGFASGMYLVYVNDGKTSREATKIVIR